MNWHRYGFQSIHNSGIISGYNWDDGDASEFNGIVLRLGTRRTDQHHQLGSHGFGFVFSWVWFDSPGSCMSLFRKGSFFLRRIRRVFRATGLLSHVFSLGCGFVWGVWVGALGEDWDCLGLLLIVDNSFYGSRGIREWII